MSYTGNKLNNITILIHLKNKTNKIILNIYVLFDSSKVDLNRPIKVCVRSHTQKDVYSSQHPFTHRCCHILICSSETFINIFPVKVETCPPGTHTL